MSAGCPGSGQSANEGPASDDDNTPGSTPATEERTLTPPDDLDSWLNDAKGYDGNRTKYDTGAQPSVWVGDPVDDEFAFSPAVIEVTPMTKVKWDWAGHGGQHNVVALDGTFDSGRTNAQSGTCFHYLFEEPGVYPYVSEPKQASGMKGAVIVKEPPSTGNEAVDDWMAGSGDFDGTVVNETDASTATVTVGADGNRGSFAFAPPVIRIATDTTVTWRWTGEGGSHIRGYLHRRSAHTCRH